MDSRCRGPRALPISCCAVQPIHATRNRLLAALPPNTLAALWPRLEPVELPLREILHEPAKPIATIYFPETGWISMVAYMEDGDAAEVGLIGHEGFVGLPVLLVRVLRHRATRIRCPARAGHGKRTGRRVPPLRHLRPRAMPLFRTSGAGH